MLALAAQAGPAAAQSTPCETQLLLGSDGRSAGKVVACSRLLSEVPALAAAVDRLNKAVEKNADAQRDLDRFVRALAATSRELPPRHLNQLAQSVAERVTRADAAGSERLGREVDRLRLDFDDWRSSLADARGKGDAAQAQAALEGRAGAAVAALDFATAKQILDGLQQVIAQTTGPFTANPTLLADARGDLRITWERLVTAKASDFCPQTWSTLVSQRRAAEDAETRQLVEAAGATYKTLNERGMALVNELNFVQQTSGMAKGSFQGLRPVVERFKDNAVQRAAGGRFSPEQAAFQRDGLRWLDESDALAAAGNHAKAYERLQDAQEALMAASSGRLIPVRRNSVAAMPFPNAQCR